MATHVDHFVDRCKAGLLLLCVTASVINTVIIIVVRELGKQKSWHILHTKNLGKMATDESVIKVWHWLILCRCEAFTISKYHRRRSGWTLGGDAWRVPKVGPCRVGWCMGRGVLLQLTKGPGGATWAPPAGSGTEPRLKTDFGVF